MNTQAIEVYVGRSTAESILAAVIHDLAPGSRAVYAGAIREYLKWAGENSYATPYESLVAFKDHLSTTVSLVTANRKLSAVRKFFETAADMGLIPETTARVAGKVKNFKVQGQKYGRRLTLTQATRMISTPDTSYLIGRRDRAILAVMIGCGLRRSEVANLTWGHIVEREGVWLIENLTGKHNRVRTIPLNEGIVAALEKYRAVWARNPADRVFYHINRHGQKVSDHITPGGIWGVVAKYAVLAGFPDIRPHDLRRTYATLARKEGGAEYDELAKILGHSSVATTERYVETALDFERAAGFVPIAMED